MGSIVYFQKKLNHPVDRVFEAFTHPEALKEWFGPRNATMISAVADFKIGGVFNFLFRTPGRKEFSIYGTYLEIIPLTKIVISFNYDGIPQTFGDSTVIFNFSSDGIGTEISLKQEFSFVLTDIDGRKASWEFMLGRLSDKLHQVTN
jgi:uncharacterized protein YndB with AHSA1/START domain